MAHAPVEVSSKPLDLCETADDIYPKTLRSPLSVALSALRSNIIQYFFAHFSYFKARWLQNQMGGLVKCVFDFVVTVLALVIFMPIMLIIAVAVRLDSQGPVIFQQTRWQGGDRVFTIYKFRTMRPDADVYLKHLLERDLDAREEYGQFHKLSNDPRVTQLGRFLRRSSLDELPQLFNVFRGNMSLVGPRPYLPKEIPLLGKNADIIGKVKPGLTGLWQISGRHRTSFKQRNKIDVFYVQNQSFLLDLYIICRTVLIFLKPNGS